MKEFRPIRTALFVPGNRPDRVDKAVNTAADAVIIDLEDAVPLTQKKETRSIVREKLIQHKDRKIIVRINSLDSEFAHGDLDEVVVERLFCIMIPKVDNAAQIQEINMLLLEREKKNGITPGSVAIIPLIESALAIENAFRIASERTEPERLFTLAFGAADFTLEMGIEITKTGEELSYPRSRLTVACRAAGIEPPLDTPFMIDLKDRQALEVDIRRAKQFGFQGKLCIHPNQVEICNSLFSPTKNEIEHAKKVVRAFNEAEATGAGVIQLEGKFIDYPVVEKSRRILKLTAMGSETPP